MDWLFGSSAKKPPTQPPEPSPPSLTSIPLPAATSQASIPKPPSDEDELMHLRYGLPIPQPTAGPSGPTPSPNPSLPESSKPESIVTYPSEMSCRQLFDFAYYCQSFGGQVSNVWRYGEFRNCKENWRAWAFCMRLKGYGEEAKREQVREWYRRQEEEKYGPVEERRPEKARERVLRGEAGWKRSSADVWEERKVSVRRAFDVDPVGEGFWRGLGKRKGRESNEGAGA